MECQIQIRRVVQPKTQKKADKSMETTEINGLRILQINVDKGKSATLLAEKKFLEDYDIALIQEPYQRRASRGSYTVFKKEGDNVVKVEIWVKGRIKATLIENLTTENFVTVQIASEENFHITTWYDEPGGRRNNRLIQFENLGGSNLEPHIMAGDPNAHNGAWGTDEDDARSEDLLEWAVGNRYLIKNDRKWGPTFQTLRGQSFVDITMARGVEVEDWRILDEETLSGHRYLSYRILVGSKKNAPRMVYDFERTNWDLFKQKIIHKCEEVNWDDINVEIKAETLQKIGREVCSRYIRKNIVNPKIHEWWNQGLERLRSRLRSKRRK